MFFHDFFSAVNDKMEVLVGILNEENKNHETFI